MASDPLVQLDIQLLPIPAANKDKILARDADLGNRIATLEAAVVVEETEGDDFETRIAALEVAVVALEAADVAAAVKVKYVLATSNRVHMLGDDQGLPGTDLGGGATQGEANTRAELLRAALVAHMAGVGTVSADGEHLAADTGNSATLAAIPAATEINSCIVLVNGLLAAIVAHGDQAGVHFHDDAAAAGTTITVDPPVSLANIITDLNDLQDAAIAHFALASV